MDKDDWQLIDTETKNKGRVLLWAHPKPVGVDSVYIGTYNDSRGWIAEGLAGDTMVQASHWMPLPEAPRSN